MFIHSKRLEQEEDLLLTVTVNQRLKVVKHNALAGIGPLLLKVKEGA